VSIVAVVDKAGREQAHGAAMELKRARTMIERVSKEAREDSTKFSKAVIAEAARLVEIVEPEEMRLLTLRDAWDDKQALIKAEAEQKERNRISEIHVNIATVRNYQSLAVDCRTSERVQALIDRLKDYWVALDIDAVFQEFSTEAHDAYSTAIASMEATHAHKFADEAERLRIKAEQEASRAELEKARAAQAEAAAALSAQRAAFAAEQEEARAALIREAKQIAAERAALDAQQREANEAKALEAYQAAVTVEPASVAPVEQAPSAPVEQADEVLEMAGHFKEVLIKPTTAKVIDLVAYTYKVDTKTAAEWLDSMDFAQA